MLIFLPGPGLSRAGLGEGSYRTLSLGGYRTFGARFVIGPCAGSYRTLPAADPERVIGPTEVTPT